MVPVTLLIDNMSVQNQVAAFLEGKERLPTDSIAHWSDIRNSARQCHELTDCRWVPSHGKYEDWRPAPPYHDDAKLFRFHNEQADSACEPPLRAWKKVMGKKVEKHRHQDHDVYVRMNSLRKYLGEFVASLTDAAEYCVNDGDFFARIHRKFEPTLVQDRCTGDGMDDQESNSECEV